MDQRQRSPGTHFPPQGPGVGWYTLGRQTEVPGAIALFLLAGICCWSYAPTLKTIIERWSHDPQYSHGFLMPLFALLILWSRRRMWTQASPRPSWWGLLILTGALLPRLAGAVVYLAWLDVISLLICLAGLVVLLGGAAGWRWAWPAILFLAFALPLPYQVEVGLAHPLQRVATTASTYCLQLLGLPALAEGNIIVIEELRIGVLEACSGLGMLVTFFALSTAFAFVIQRPLADKIVLFLSALPIGVCVNVLRITATGLLHRVAGSAVANAVFHDLAGWLMMPLAVVLLWLVLCLLDHLFIPQAYEPEV